MSSPTVPTKMRGGWGGAKGRQSGDRSGSLDLRDPLDPATSVPVALYHPWVYLRSGIERTFVELLTRSRHHWTIYTHHYEGAATYPELPADRVVELAPAVSVRRSLTPLLGAALTIGPTRLPD